MRLTIFVEFALKAFLSVLGCYRFMFQTCSMYFYCGMYYSLFSFFRIMMGKEIIIPHAPH